MQLESFVKYYHSHDELNNIVKISAASFETISRIVNGDNDGYILGALVDSTSNPWGKKRNYPNACSKIDIVKNEISNMLVVHSLTRFEEYLKDLYYDLCLYTTIPIIYNKQQIIHNNIFNAANPPEKDIQVCDQIDGLLWNVKTKNIINHLLGLLNLQDPTLTQLMPLYHYFRIGRNCIVHSNGIVNREFENHMNDPNLLLSYNFWNSSCLANAHPLKHFAKNDRIQLEMVDAILASAVCRKIADLLNSLAVQRCTNESFIYMAAYNAIIIENHEYRIKASDMPNLVRHFIYTQYGKDNITKSEIVRYLKQIGLYNEMNIRFTDIAQRF